MYAGHVEEDAAEQTMIHMRKSWLLVTAQRLVI